MLLTNRAWRKVLPFYLVMIFSVVAKGQQPIVKRMFFGATLEPKSAVLSGAGQSPEAFRNYVNVMGNDYAPVLYMDYASLRNTDFEAWVEKRKQLLKEYPEMVIPQIGLSMTKDGTPDQHYEGAVADGLYDDQLKKMAVAFRKFNTPIFLRIGYEFNGRWNGYEAESFIKAFRKVVDVMRTHGPSSTAIVWCFATDGSADFTAFYPGDEYVDWWGIDLFNKEHFKDPKTIAFLDSAMVHRKPVMIGESTPRRVGVLNGQASWNEWFLPYFTFIHAYPQIKAFCYINWDWSSYPQWKDWGDGRLEGNSVVAKEFLYEMKKPLYMHQGKTKKLEKALRFSQ